MNLTSILAAAKRLVTVTPRTAFLDATTGELALAIHATKNEGRIARFGAAYCTCMATAEHIVAYLREREANR